MHRKMYYTQEYSHKTYLINTLPYLSVVYYEAVVLDTDQTELFERCVLARI